MMILRHNEGYDQSATKMNLQWDIGTLLKSYNKKNSQQVNIQGLEQQCVQYVTSVQETHVHPEENFTILHNLSSKYFYYILLYSNHEAKTPRTYTAGYRTVSA